MGKKQDIQQVNAIAKEFKMSAQARKLFGKFLEEEKQNSNGGSLNARGDFTWEELRQKAQEFLEE